MKKKQVHFLVNDKTNERLNLNMQIGGFKSKTEYFKNLVERDAVSDFVDNNVLSVKNIIEKLLNKIDGLANENRVANFILIKAAILIISLGFKTHTISQNEDMNKIMEEIGFSKQFISEIKERALSGDRI